MTPAPKVPSRETPVNVNEFLSQDKEPSASPMFWSRVPGKIVNKFTGERSKNLTTMSGFSPIEWYMTLQETLTDAANSIHRKSLRGSANVIVVPPDIQVMLECLVSYKPFAKQGVAETTFEDAEFVGELLNRFNVYTSDDMPENLILVARLGDGFEHEVTEQGPIPQINLSVAKDPRFFKGEIAWWTTITILDLP